SSIKSKSAWDHVKKYNTSLCKYLEQRKSEIEEITKRNQKNPLFIKNFTAEFLKTAEIISQADSFAEAIKKCDDNDRALEVNQPTRATKLAPLNLNAKNPLFDDQETIQKNPAFNVGKSAANLFITMIEASLKNSKQEWALCEIKLTLIYQKMRREDL